MWARSKLRVFFQTLKQTKKKIEDRKIILIKNKLSWLWLEADKFLFFERNRGKINA